MPRWISKREAGRLIGVSEKAVRKAILSGRIKAVDGKVDAETVQDEWARSTEPTRTKVRGPVSAGPQPVVRTEADARDAIGLVRRILIEEGHVSEGELTFADMRTAETIIKIRERELKLAERRKEVIPVSKAREHIERAFIGYRQAVQRLPSRHAAAIAAALGCDPAALDKALSQAIADELDTLSTPVVGA